MNDKQQLATMGEHLAEQQQPMCLQKRVEQLEALLREVRDMMDNQPRGFSGMMHRIDEALGMSQHEMHPVYYMRDNHTFKRLSDDVGTAIAEIVAELDAGFTSGMLCSKRLGFSNIGTNFRESREEFLSKCRKAMLAAAPKPGDADV